MKYNDMLVEVPALCADLEDESREDGINCSSCGVSADSPTYRAEELWTIRHWTTDSIDEPGGGHWRWYCAEHLATASLPWVTSRLAPARLLPSSFPTEADRAAITRTHRITTNREEPESQTCPNDFLILPRNGICAACGWQAPSVNGATA